MRDHVLRMAELRPAVLARAAYHCERCGRLEGSWNHDLGRYVALEAHHRLMRSQGGPDTMENLVALCGPNPAGCHGWVHAHPTESYTIGLLIKRSSGPPSEPFDGSCLR